MEDFFGPTDSGGNLPYTINQGLNWLENAKIGHAQILVISDNQKSNWEIQENDQLLKILMIELIIRKDCGNCVFEIRAI